MRTVQLQIEDDYFETFLEMLPPEKVRIVDQTFLDNQTRLQEELENFLHGKGEFTSYYEAMKEMDNWLREGGKE